MLRFLILSCFLAAATAKRLVLMGGGMADGNDAVWGKFVDWSGGASAKIGVISAASSTPESSASWYVQHFLGHGAGVAEWIPIHEGNTAANSDPNVVSQINSMNAIFFSGGDQARIINSLYNGGSASPALLAIQSVYNNGGTIGGSSAGAACLPSAPMIMGGMSWYALRYGAYPAPAPTSNDLEYNPAGGIGVLEDFIPDSHFSERGREGRLIRLISDTRGSSNGVTKGIGVGEDTALFIEDAGTPNAEGEVIGSNGVYIPDLTSATAGTTSGYWSISNVRTYYLTHNDKISMSTLSVTFANWKISLEPEKYQNGITSNKIFNGNRDNPSNDPELVRVSSSIFDAWGSVFTNGRTQTSNPRFAVDFTQEGSSTGRGGYHPTSGRWQIAYSNLRVDIHLD